VRWYAVQTRAGKEKSALAQLRQQHFTAFLPLRRSTVRHARQFRTVQVPLFVNYLFVELDLERHRWRTVNGTFGVSSLVMAGTRPTPVPGGVVEQLVAAADECGLVDLAGYLRPGARVELSAGPLTGLLGTIATTNDAGRVKVLLDLMRGATAVWIEQEALRPVA
jgi:transcriptional antiterminator RfaH